MGNEAEAKKDSTAVAGNGTVAGDSPVIVNNNFGERERRDSNYEQSQQTSSTGVVLKVVLVVSVLGNVVMTVICVTLIMYINPILQRVWQLQERNQDLMQTCEGGAKFSYAVVKKMLSGGY